MLLLLSPKRLTWLSVSHSRLLRFVRIIRIKVNLNKLKKIFLSNGYPDEVIVDTINKTVNKFKNNIRPFVPSKCPVYVRLPWIGSPRQLIVDKVSSSVTSCCNAAMVRTIFTTWAAFRSIHKDVLHIFQQINLIYKFQCCCNATYIGCSSQCLEVRVKQHVPSDIRDHTTSGHSKLLDSAICEHFNALNSCMVNYRDKSFVVLRRARTKLHRIVLEAIHFLFNRPSICTQNLKRPLNLLGDISCLT